MAKNRESVDEGEMTEFGRALWIVIQQRGAYSRAGIGRKLNDEIGWKPSRQAISNWLKGEREVPRELVPAVIKAFHLTEEESKRLEYLYFYGQGGPASERWRRAQEAAEEPGENGTVDQGP